MSEVVVLRILHIAAGVLWAGGAVYTVAVVEPVFRAAGPDVMKKIGPGIGARTTVFMHVTGLLTIIMGLVLIDRTAGRDFGQLFTNGWGTAIGAGLVTAVLGYLLGAAGGLQMKKAIDMGASLQGPPPPEVASRIGALQARFRTWNRVAAALIVVAVGTMAAARFV